MDHHIFHLCRHSARPFLSSRLFVKLHTCCLSMTGKKGGKCFIRSLNKPCNILLYVLDELSGERIVLEKRKSFASLSLES